MCGSQSRASGGAGPWTGQLLGWPTGHRGYEGHLTRCHTAPRPSWLLPRCQRWHRHTGSPRSLQAAQFGAKLLFGIEGRGEGKSCSAAGLAELPAVRTCRMPACVGGFDVPAGSCRPVHTVGTSPAYLVPGSLGFTTWHDSPPPLVPARTQIRNWRLLNQCVQSRRAKMRT